MRYVSLFLLCLPLEASVIMRAEAYAISQSYPLSRELCSTEADHFGSIYCRADADTSWGFSIASSSLYHGFVEAQANFRMGGDDSASATVDFSDTLVILGGTGQGELWGGWFVSHNYPCDGGVIRRSWI